MIIFCDEQLDNNPVSRFVADFVGFENIFANRDGKLVSDHGEVTVSGPLPAAEELAWRPRMVTLGSGPFQGTVRGISFAGSSREYVLETPLGIIKAETDAALAPHALGNTVDFDLPVASAASLKRFG